MLAPTEGWLCRARDCEQAGHDGRALFIPMTCLSPMRLVRAATAAASLVKDSRGPAARDDALRDECHLTLTFRGRALRGAEDLPVWNRRRCLRVTMTRGVTLTASRTTNLASDPATSPTARGPRHRRCSTDSCNLRRACTAAGAATSRHISSTARRMLAHFSRELKGRW
jgi:hypothetical protein